MKSTDHKKKIVLVSPGPQRIQFGAIAHMPLALLSLAAWLEKFGDYENKIEIIDGQIQTIQPDSFADAGVVGITAMTGYQIKYGLEVAAIARQANPNVLVVWGGVHSSLLPEQTVSHPLVDIVVMGEGEQTFLEIVDNFFANESINDIAGTCFQQPNDKIVIGEKRDFLNLDDLPLPAYHLIDIDNYKGIHFQFDYQSSRGCPYRCGFCYNVVFCNRRYRKKSAKKVVDELIYLCDKYKVTNFGFVDDEFFIEKKQVEAILDRINESGRILGIVASCRLDVVCGFPSSLLEKMHDCGVAQIFFGAESGSSRMLENIQKDITREQIIEGSTRVAEAGIRPILSFMSGFPDEEKEDLEQTLDLIRELWDTNPLITINGIFPFNAYPGTLLYKRAIELEFTPPENLEDWGEWSFQYNPDNLWLDSSRKQCMQIAFYMVRFKYYTLRYFDRHKGNYRCHLLKFLTLPLSLSLTIRLKKRWFSMAWEWHLFAFLVRKTFGYL